MLDYGNRKVLRYVLFYYIVNQCENDFYLQKYCMVVKKGLKTLTKV